MNPNTLNAIAGVIGLINPALSVISAFVGEANASKVTKITDQVKDAVDVVTALSPFVTAFGEGKDVTPEDVRASLANSAERLATFDELISQKGG